MALIDKIRSLARDETDELRAAEAELAEAKAAYQRMHRELANERHDQELGRDDAAPRIAAAIERLAPASTRMQQAEGRLNKLRTERDAAARERAAREAAERERSIPGLAAAYADSAAKVQQCGAELGNLIREWVTRARALGAAIDTPDARRVFGQAVIANLVQHCLTDDFNAVPEVLSPGHPSARAQVPPFRFLPYPINEGSPLCKTSLTTAVLGVLDEQVRVFASRRDALRARKRIDASGQNLHPVKSESGVWRLVPGRLQGAAAALPPEQPEPEEEAA